MANHAKKRLLKGIASRVAISTALITGAGWAGRSAHTLAHRMQAVGERKIMVREAAAIRAKGIPGALPAEKLKFARLLKSIDQLELLTPNDQKAAFRLMDPAIKRIMNKVNQKKYVVKENASISGFRFNEVEPENIQGKPYGLEVAIRVKMKNVTTGKSVEGKVLVGYPTIRANMTEQERAEFDRLIEYIPEARIDKLRELFSDYDQRIAQSKKFATLAPSALMAIYLLIYILAKKKKE